ncbi:MAG: putative membrane protein [Candidatus Bathyarchaeota archaeon B63]|nr:MAG: putative membrane protein [Candidatus Bathyarchaeota archaeon B63]
MQAVLAGLGFILIILGFMITLAAAIMMFIRAASLRKKARGGGLIMIGPLPIIFGTDKEAMKILIILAIVLMIFAVILMLIPYMIR